MISYMETDVIIVLAILIVTVFMLVFEIVRIDVVAICCMLVLGWSGVLNTQEMFSGFSSNAVIAMLSVMILGKGIARTGIMDGFSKFIIKKAGNKKNKLLGLLSASTGVMSGFIQNIGAAALFLPGILQISRRTRIPPSSLIMPVGFAAILGGTLSMVGSGPLILVNDFLKNDGHQAYNLFSVTPVGIILLTSGILFFMLAGKYVLPKPKTATNYKSEQEKLVEKLNLPSNITFFTVTETSPLIGKTTEQSGVWNLYNIHVIGIGFGNETTYAPWRETKFISGQIIALLGDDENLEKFAHDYSLKKKENQANFEQIFTPELSGFAEIIVPPGSDLVGKTIRDFSFRKRYALEPVMLFNKGEKVQGDFSDVEISPGDILIIHGQWEKMLDVKASSDFVVITSFQAEKKDYSKAWRALGCFSFAIILAMVGFPISMAFLTGAVCMIFTKVLNISQAYQAVEWKVVFLLAGLIPLGVAMQKSGTATFLAESIMYYAKDFHPIFLIAIIGVISTVFSLFMSNVGAIVVLAPLVMSMAGIADIDPRPLVLMAAICAANSFILPTHQVNAFLMSSGGYRNKDYIKAGSGITILFLVIVVLIFYFFMI